jgi:phosphocarrier protein HPr
VAAIEKTLVLVNKVGLHARPASLWVQTAGRFKAKITVVCSGRTANAKSILEVLQLGARYGAELVVTAEGDDAPDAIAALTELVQTRFGEAE